MAISDAERRATRPERLRTKLTPEEQSIRSSISIKERWGQDTTDQRKQLAKLIATREFREAAERLVAARQAQGFPDRVEDAATLARIATLLAAPETKTAPTPTFAGAVQEVGRVSGAT
jgi:phosphopantetheine adenylyltransferase